MNTAWEVNRLGALCDILNGSTPSKLNSSYWEQGTVPWFTIDDLRDQGHLITSTRKKITRAALEESSVKLLPPDSVLLCCTASVGEIAMAKIPLTTNQQFNGLVVRDRARLHPDFLFHFAATLKEQLFELSGKTTIDFIPISRLKNVLVPVPSLDEQKRIVASLDAAFAVISKTKDRTEEGSDSAATILRSFRQKALFARNTSWNKTKLGDTVDLLSGLAFKSSGYTTNHEDVPLLGGDNILQGKLRWENARRWPVQEATTYQRYFLQEKDVVLAMDRPWVSAGLKCAIVSSSDLPSLLIQRTARLRSLKGLDHSFLFHLLCSDEFAEHVLRAQTGIGVPHISAQQISSFEFYLPPLKEQQSIVRTLDCASIHVNRVVECYNKKLAALDELKKAIRHKAFSGELTKAASA